MPQQVFIKVIGFSDVERHALNTLFRLSEQRPTSYCLWAPEAPVSPQLLLLDGQSYEARLEAESPQNKDLRLVWIGDDPPQHAWHAFERPLAWPDVVEAIDDHFMPPTEVEFELDLGSGHELDDGPATLPPDEVPDDRGPSRRALIANSDLGERLYLRAKLALNALTVADEAETAAQALELMRGQKYTVALVDFSLPDSQGWTLIRQLKRPDSGISHLIVTKERTSVGERVRAWFAGIDLFLDKPADPEKLQQALQKME